jgi:hypothetical protein
MTVPPLDRRLAAAIGRVSAGIAIGGGPPFAAT